MSERRGAIFARLLWVLGGLVLVAGAAAVVFQFERRGEFSPAVRGERLATEAGCFACHGPSEDHRRGNFRQLASGVWRPKNIPTLWENGLDRADVLKDWIAHGVPAAEAEAHRRLFIQMPAYSSFYDARQIDDLAAWILAEQVGRARVGGTPDDSDSRSAPAPGTPEFRRAADHLARQHGCYSCHGEQGQGGVRNPAAFKGYIPGFFGRDFLALTAGGDREEILHWIDTGRGRHLESGWLGRLAKHFGDSQAIGMPAYRDRLTEAEKQMLVDYLLMLHREGPLDAAGFEQALRDLTADSSAL